MKILLRITLALALIWVLAPGDSKISEVTSATEAYASASPSSSGSGCTPGTLYCQCTTTWPHCIGEAYCDANKNLCYPLNSWGSDCCRGCKCR